VTWTTLSAVMETMRQRMATHPLARANARLLARPCLLCEMLPNMRI
jgi:uncharacterized protein (DUF2267 family)